MRASDVMTTPVTTVHPSDPVRTAAELLLRHEVASLPVVDEQRRVVGMISEIDIARSRAPHDPRSRLRAVLEPGDLIDPATSVAALMSRDVVVVRPRDDIADLARVMSARGVRAVPVVDADDALVGIVSRRDLLRAVERDDAAIAHEVVSRLRALGGDGRMPWRVAVRDGVVTLTGSVADGREAEVLRVLVSTVPGVVRTHVPVPDPDVGAGR